MNPRQYANPPVREAIFTVTFQDTLPLSTVEEFCKADWASKRYPTTLPVIEVEVKMGEGTTATPSTKIAGRRMRSESDQKTLLHITKTQFSFHNYDKYLGWEKASELFIAAWKEFSNFLDDAVQISSIGVRYINEINLPEDAREKPQIYLELLPQLPKHLSIPVQKFFVQIEVNDNNKNIRGVITETLLSSKYNAGIRILLDINSTIDFNKGSNDLSEALNTARLFKNKLFEDCITDPTRSLFNSI